MALLSQDPPLPDAASALPETALAELTLLLLRLQNNLLHPTPSRERRLRTSECERAKAEANLNYARNVLTKLEQDALRLKAPARRAETQSLLNVNRDRLETLLDRLEDLRHIARDDDDGSSDEEDLLGHVISTPGESMDSRSSDTRDEPQSLETPPEPPTPEPEPVVPHETPRRAPSPSPSPSPSPTPVTPSQSTTQITQTLRSRSSARPTPPSYTTATAALYASRPKPPEPQTTTATAKAILDNQKAEQDDLSRSILQLAGALKESSKRFAITLEADKDVLEKTGEGMTKAEQGMQFAAGRMGKLRKMTEGQGWWGRMILYAWVYGLMLSLVLLVFLMPKLRF
ncbi:synaptobrevin [Metarhizium album ARSEF 1941]|uniref:Synaptobrevin n=1 Tax=Metarhizium album (strain ARSEF 1941) TaxID=1081103 RepID=A0A0B2X632_METAS|nr:synaptobrevin [Metarhizium album ARSEF 1941]KHO00736.1 synaptobrevin [Metarhizium album ARSEF 1941]